MDPNASPTVRIVYPANLRVGYCQIPASEFDPEVHVLWSDPSDPTAGNGGALSDEQLRDAIEAATGKRPHHKLGRAKLEAIHQSLSQEA